MTWADDVVNLMSDSPGKINLIHPGYYLAAIAPMWYFMNPNVELQVIVAIFITMNSFDRIMFPSQYNPALSAKDNILYHPFTARTFATLAETTMYWVWATWVYQPFWGAPLGFIVVTGEIVCWCGILFQSHTIHLCEDTIWTIHSAM